MGLNIREIAKLAGVSPTTVSFVINNKKGVSEETRAKVKMLIAEKGYVRRKSVNRHAVPATVCIIKYNNGHKNYEFESLIIDRLNDACNQMGMQTYMSVCDRSNFTLTLRNVVQMQYGGILLIGTYLQAEQILQLKYHEISGRPLVVLDNAMANTNISSVSVSSREIGQIAVQYLYCQGMRRIEYLSSGSGTNKSKMLKQGYTEAVVSLGLDELPAIELGSATIADAYAEMKAWLNRENVLPQAFLVENGTIALGTMRALQEMRIRVPEDVSIISCEDLLFGGFSSPALSAFSCSYDNICKMAVRNLVEIMNENNINRTAVHMMLTGKLIERESVKLTSMVKE